MGNHTKNRICMAAYSIDSKKFTLDQFLNLIRTKRLLPGRKMLEDRMDERFISLHREGIENLHDLFVALKTKQQVTELSIRTGIPFSYLVVLKREAGSYIPKSVNLSALQGIPYEFIKMLESKGIHNTRQLLAITGNTLQKQKLSKETGIPVDRLEELECLSELTGIHGVGGTFARIIFEAGIHSVKEFAEMDPDEGFRNLMNINILRNYNASFTIEDVKFCVHYAKVLITYGSDG